MDIRRTVAETASHGVYSIHFGRQLTTNIFEDSWKIIRDPEVIDKLQAFRRAHDSFAPDNAELQRMLREIQAAGPGVGAESYRRDRPSNATARQTSAPSPATHETPTAPASTYDFIIPDFSGLETRTIHRADYHGSVRHYSEAIAMIPVDYDGVKRTYGLEYEIYSLNSTQESHLAHLLDHLPPCVTERDGSLGSGGVELVFMPMSESNYIKTVKTLAKFVKDEHISMDCGEENMAGMHTRYGVSNSECNRIGDAQIRLNRIALCMLGCLTKAQIISLFGRTFGHYRSSPSHLTQNDHANAFSCNSPVSSDHGKFICWECRLPSWKCDPERLVAFFKATEFAFHRAFVPADLGNILALFSTEATDI